MRKKLLTALCLAVLSASTLFAQFTKTNSSYGETTSSLASDSLNQDDHSGMWAGGVLRSNLSGITATNETTVTKTHLYPNPSKGMVFLITSTEFTTSEISVEVSDLSGKTIRNSKIKYQESRQVDLSELTDGLYFLKLTVGNKTTVRKVVIDRN